MPRPSARRGIALALSALLVPALAACGSSDEKKNKDDSATKADAAKGASELVIYSGRNEELIDPIIGKLEKATGADVEVRYGDSAELAAQILEEGDRTKAGLFFSQDAGALGALSQAGMLAKLPAKSLEKVDPAYRGGEGDWVGVSGRSRVIAYNPDELAKGVKAPDSVHDLTKPQWKGKVGYAPTNASFQAFVTGMRVLEGDGATLKWLKGLKANGAKTYAKNGAVLDAVDSGEVSLGLINHYYWYEKVAELGADKVKAKIHFLPGGDAGALINAAGVGVLKDGGQDAAAQKAVDFLLSKEAQTYFAEGTKEYPLASGVTSTVEGLPSLESLDAPKIDLGKLESLQKTLELLKEAGMV